MLHMSATHAQENEAVCTHLFSRNRRYYIRRRIPIDLVEHYKRKDIQKALGTSDPIEARIRCRKIGAQLDEEFARVRVELADTPPPQCMTVAEADAWQRAELEYQELLETFQAEEEFEAEEFEKLKRALRAVLAENGTLLPATPFVPPLDEVSPNSKGTSLTMLANKWAGERQPDARTIGIMNRVISRFESFVGKMPVEHITRRHIVQFKDK